MVQSRRPRTRSPELPRTRIEETSDLWWKNAIVYCLDVETFLDTNGDGIGDFEGLIQRIDYLAGLGVTCLWLMPFYPSPNRDDGYDVADYYGIDPRLGDFGDFVAFVRTANDRGIRVIADLVVNHTSIEHPWFEAARESRDSPFRDYYVWCDEPPQEQGPMMFPGEQESSWSFDERTGQYYLHRFYAHQPDLNAANPELREEMLEIAAFWLQLGLAGFRVDAVPHWVALEMAPEDVQLAPHDLTRELRSFLARRRGDVLLLGEVNQPPAEAAAYFGEEHAEELQMLFAFAVNQYLYLSLARQDAAPLRACLEELPPIPSVCQWAQFVTNHDELTLDQLSDSERAEVFDAFAPEEGMQIYGRGIRRRLPTMLGGDERRVRMVYSLLFALPGTPVLYYGEEIGMGEDLDTAGRAAVRTPMQWSDEVNGGFSTAHSSELFRRPPDGPYGPARVNVASQRRDDDSLLSWFERLVRRRRECPEIGLGQWRVIDGGASALLAHVCQWSDIVFVAVHNFSGEAQLARLDLEPPSRFVELVELWSDSRYEPLEPGSLEVPIEPHGFRWFRTRVEGRRAPL